MTASPYRLSLRLLQAFHFQLSVSETLAVHVCLHLRGDAVELIASEVAEEHLRVCFVRHDQWFVLGVVGLVPVEEDAYVDIKSASGWRMALLAEGRAGQGEIRRTLRAGLAVIPCTYMYTGMAVSPWLLRVGTAGQRAGTSTTCGQCCEPKMKRARSAFCIFLSQMSVAFSAEPAEWTTF